MREILFRGQTRRYGEKVWMNGEKVPSNWVYGGICQGKGDFSIIYGSMDIELEQPTEKRVVYTDTIGQYTGLTDKNGTKIFEGDIIRDEEGSMDGIPRMVSWDEKDMVFRCPLVRNHWAYGYSNCSLWLMRYKNIEVIGNVHDNPELLEGSVGNESKT